LYGHVLRLMASSLGGADPGGALRGPSAPTPGLRRYGRLLGFCALSDPAGAIAAFAAEISISEAPVPAGRRGPARRDPSRSWVEIAEAFGYETAPPIVGRRADRVGFPANGLRPRRDPDPPRISKPFAVSFLGLRTMAAGGGGAQAPEGRMKPENLGRLCRLDPVRRRRRPARLAGRQLGRGSGRGWRPNGVLVLRGLPGRRAADLAQKVLGLIGQELLDDAFWSTPAQRGCPTRPSPPRNSTPTRIISLHSEMSYMPAWPRPHRLPLPRLWRRKAAPPTVCDIDAVSPRAWAGVLETVRRQGRRLPAHASAGASMCRGRGRLPHRPTGPRWKRIAGLIDMEIAWLPKRHPADAPQGAGDDRQRGPASSSGSTRRTSSIPAKPAAGRDASRWSSCSAPMACRATPSTATARKSQDCGDPTGQRELRAAHLRRAVAGGRCAADRQTCASPTAAPTFKGARARCMWAMANQTKATRRSPLFA